MPFGELLDECTTSLNCKQTAPKGKPAPRFLEMKTPHTTNKAESLLEAEKEENK
jgi:hypothetical protein